MNISSRWEPIKLVIKQTQRLGDYARMLLHDPRIPGVFAFYQTVVGGGRNALRTCLYRLAISLSVPWPAAYTWYIETLAVRASTNIESNDYDAAYAAKLDAAAIQQLDRLEQFAPNLQSTAELRVDLQCGPAEPPSGLRSSTRSLIFKRTVRAKEASDTKASIFWSRTFTFLLALGAPCTLILTSRLASLD